MANADDKCRLRYAIRCPFPDEDMYCFVLDKDGKVAYYETKANAEERAKEIKDAVIVETRYFGI
jgi:hypothetical protein